MKAEGIVIATEWKEFLEISWEKVYETMNKPAFVFDGRLLVDHVALERIGFTVSSVSSHAGLELKHSQVTTIGRASELRATTN